MPSHCIQKGGRGVGGLVHGGGGLAICGGVGGWRKRWCDDDGFEVGARGHIETAQPSLSLLLSTLGVRPYPVPAATGRNRLTNGASETPTTAPNPPHTTCTNQWCRGRVASAAAQLTLNASCTQPGSAYPGAGGGGVYQRVAQVNHGGTTPQTPQTRPVSLEAEEITRRNLDVRPQGESINRGDRGAFGRASTPWWMGRHGKAKGGP